MPLANAVPLPASTMPKPEQLIGNGAEASPAMFWYATEGQSLAAIAREHGFEMRVSMLELDVLNDEDEAQKRYDQDPDAVLAEYAPVAPEGFTYAGRWHGEEGPVVCWLRKLPDVSAAP